MDKNNLTEEQYCSFCYNLCRKCNWDTNSLWKVAKRYNIPTQEVKNNARIYMKKYLYIPNEEISKKNNFFMPYQIKKMLTTYNEIINILINNNIVTTEAINNIRWLELNLKLHIARFCFDQVINTNWDKEQIKLIANSINITEELLIKNAKEYATKGLNWTEQEWKAQANNQNNLKHYNNKYAIIFDKILELENTELLEYLEENKKIIPYLRSTIHSYVMNKYPNEYNQMRSKITNKINTYTKIQSEKRNKEKEKLKIKKAMILISDFIESNKTLDNYCKENNISKDKFNNQLKLIKEKNPTLYKKYIFYTNSIKEINDNKTNKLLEELINIIKTNKNFTILDYYLITNIDPKKLIPIAKIKLNSKDLKLFYNFINESKTKTVMSEQDKKDILNGKTIIGTKFDKNNNPIPNTGKEITKEEIEQIFNFLKRNKIPIYPRVYKIALKRYANNELDINNKKEKRKVLIK